MEITTPLLLSLSDSLSTQFNIQFEAAPTQWADICSDVTSLGMTQGYTMETLARHPVAEVRQRAEEAQAALHHGAPDAGIKMRAAMDVARRAERTR